MRTMVHMNDIITVVGNAASDPESIETSTGKALTKVRVASTARRYNPSTQQWEDSGTNWYTVRAWGRLAEHLRASVQKGMQLVVQGRLKIDVRKGDTATFTNIDIDADTVGVSLQFGTVRFQRSAGQQQSPQAPEPQGAASSGGDSSQQSAAYANAGAGGGMSGSEYLPF
ncbi:Single-stranded DNA-binding protein [Agrococcus casei LMG 22410]|uniref:Single-stranded DNA-binding protein n=2 Tax=Agrococcus TaxID=46352 RepID=A0A1R4G6W5_9MICO|nr:Single-stranded DNA-binding protein [Agrococcus casei LMG 22410]